MKKRKLPFPPSIVSGFFSYQDRETSKGIGKSKKMGDWEKLLVDCGAAPWGALRIFSTPHFLGLHYQVCESLTNMWWKISLSSITLRCSKSTLINHSGDGDEMSITFQMRIVMSYWLLEPKDTGEMAAPMAILLLVWINPEHRRL